MVKKLDVSHERFSGSASQFAMANETRRVSTTGGGGGEERGRHLNWGSGRGLSRRKARALIGFFRRGSEAKENMRHMLIDSNHIDGLMGNYRLYRWVSLVSQ